MDGYSLIRRIGSAAVVGTAVCGLTLGVGTASAAPADPLAPIGSFAYQQVFAMGIPVYELARREQAPKVEPPADQLVLRRIAAPEAGTPDTPKYVFGGSQLPPEFVVAETEQGSNVPTGVVGVEPGGPQIPYRQVNILGGPLTVPGVSGPIWAGYGSDYLG